MASKLAEFLVSIGFAVDTASQARAEGAVAKTEAKATAVTQAESEKRRKVEDRSAAKREKQADDAAKKEAQRRKTAFADMEKGLARVESVATRVAGVMGVVGGAIAGSLSFRAIAATADAYSRLMVESRRSGASPKNIEALVYSLGQRGVDKGEARSSFDNFARAIQQSPGLKALIAGAGIDTNQDTAKVFAQLGRYFGKMPYQTALAMAGRFGIGQDPLNALLKGGVAEGMGQYGDMAGAFGLDVDKAAKEGRDFTAAYDRVALDLSHAKDKMQEQFFKPLTAGMTLLADLMERNPKAAKDMEDGLRVMADAINGQVIPTVLRLSQNFSGLQAPDWLTMLLGVPTAMKLAQGAGSGPAGAPGAAQGGASIPVEEDRATRARSGDADQRNWWQRHAPGWLGGKEATVSTPAQLPSGPAPGASGFGLTNAPYRRAVDLKGEGGFLSPQEHYDYLRSIGATHNEALMLTGAAGSESSFNPNAIHDGGRGHGLYGHNDARLDMRGQGWQYQSSAALAELRRRPEGSMVNNATSTEDLADAQMHFEQPRGYTRSNPRGGDNYTGRLNTLRYFGQAFMPKAPPSLKRSDVKTDVYGNALNPDGTPTMNNFDPKTGMVTAPIGPQSYYNRGDSHFTQNINVNGVQRPQEVADAIVPVARRGARDHIRFMQGSSA